MLKRQQVAGGKGQRIKLTVQRQKRIEDEIFVIFGSRLPIEMPDSRGDCLAGHEATQRAAQMQHRRIAAGQRGGGSGGSARVGRRDGDDMGPKCAQRRQCLGQRHSIAERQIVDTNDMALLFKHGGDISQGQRWFDRSLFRLWQRNKRDLHGTPNLAQGQKRPTSLFCTMLDRFVDRSVNDSAPELTERSNFCREPNTLAKASAGGSASQCVWVRVSTAVQVDGLGHQPFAASARSIGVSEKEKQLPWPSWLSTQIRPWCPSMIC